MNTTIRTMLFSSMLALGAAASAQAGTLEYQGVSFTSSWTDNVLTLEIDAAHRNGSWLKATTIGALQLKNIGSFDSVALTAAPGGAANWTLSSSELNANGCGGGAHVGASLCFSGDHVALSDDMVFKFTFNGGATDFASPHVKVNFFDGDGGRKAGSLLSANIPMQPVPEPSTYAMMLGGLALLGGMVKRRRPMRG